MICDGFVVLVWFDKCEIVIVFVQGYVIIVEVEVCVFYVIIGLVLVIFDGEYGV